MKTPGAAGRVRRNGSVTGEYCFPPSALLGDHMSASHCRKAPAVGAETSAGPRAPLQLPVASTGLDSDPPEGELLGFISYALFL